MRAADTGPEPAGHPGALPPYPAGGGSGAGAAPPAGTGGRRRGHSRSRGHGRRRAARPAPSPLRRTAFGTAGLLCLVLGTSLALAGRGESPVVRIETSGHGAADTPPPPVRETPAPPPVAASPPTRLLIPAAGVDAPVTGLGLNPDGTVEVPAADHGDEVGWYRNGPTPGETGPAVLIGHYDTVHGPAVFRNVPKLKPGDLIRVRRADGGTVDFKVSRLVQAAKDRFPTEQVYGDTPAPALRLITCGGRIGADGHWTDNIIVLADPA
ncbi:class F sortase [Streptomyces rubellomurinus]|uniref:Class F sortase n=1 Tax=Streptomyces sp. Y1 TaxID=3238634 RepID=A0AB39TIW2_9ACTN|nr:class F sortase [Streptomyces rubellomurinus]